MTNKNFSVSICVYKGDDPCNFNAALNSVIDQTIRPSEIVLTVDGPIPENIEKVIRNKIKELKKTSISFKVIRLKKNVGHGKARNIGIQNCSNQLIALMDSDDISVCNRFMKQINYFVNNNDVSVVGGLITEFVSGLDPQDTTNVVGKRVVPTDDTAIKRYMKKRCPFNQVTVMFKKNDVNEVGGYIDWFCNEDYYLWIRLAKAGKKFANIPETLVNVRVGFDMYQRRGGIKYFQSEFKIQKLMYTCKIIGGLRFLTNVFERLIVQVIMPNRIRGLFFQKFARARQS